MAERPRAHVNLVAEEMLRFLSLIGKPEKSRWLMEPKTVEMMTGPGDLKKALPGVFLEVVSVGPDRERRNATNINSELATFRVHCVVQDVSDPSGICHDLMADVERTIRENRNLDTRNGLLASGMLETGERKCSIESAEGGAGLAVGYVEVLAHYLTSNAAP